MCLLVLLLNALGIWITIEQPDSSTLEYHPRLQLVLGCVHMYKIRFRMWDFGGPTAKGTLLYANKPWIDGLLRHKVDRSGEKPEKKLCTYQKNEHGITRFTASPDLKGSQEYQRGFGIAMAKLFATHKDQLADGCATTQKRVDEAHGKGDTCMLMKLLSQSFPDGKQGWADANVDGVFQYLRGLA